MAKKSAKSKGYRKTITKKPYLGKKDIIWLCVIVALLAVGAFFLFRYDDGALKVQDGAVLADGDNWLIADGSNVRGRSRYYKLGEIGEVEGYAREKGTALTDVNIPQYSFTAEAEGGVETLNVTCSHNAAEALAKYTMAQLEPLPTTTLGELQTVFEAVLGTPMDPSNFRRSILGRYEKTGRLTQTEQTEKKSRGRPAALYRFR